jgi:hypothetical protein
VKGSASQQGQERRAEVATYGPQEIRKVGQGAVTAQGQVLVDKECVSECEDRQEPLQIETHD